MYRAIYPVDNPSDYWKISLYLVFFDHLVEEISKRVVSKEERGGVSYLNPARLLNITPEIVDKLLNTYQKGK
jgi:hypothetical protein